jgi:hypothetical protein
VNRTRNCSCQSKHVASGLQISKGHCCLGKELQFSARTVRHTQPLRSVSYFATDGQSASLFWYRACNRSLWPVFIHSDIYGCLVGRPPWREDGPIIYSCNCYWASPALPLSFPSPAELWTISCSLIWDWVPFLSLLKSRRATAEEF